MKTAIIYYSGHHGNTKKLLDKIAQDPAVTLIEAEKADGIDLSSYDLIGFASGIYFSKFHKTVVQAAKTDLKRNDTVFLIYTCGKKSKRYPDELKNIIAEKGAKLLGVYSCVGWDTFGPFKLIGGTNKHRPNEKDLTEANAFYQLLIQQKSSEA
ncbi:MAG: hypothetical protein LKJ03_03555 [Enterococcaceae bacterium]|jgi:flavodoxin|nr:hypothetical protein [Enterococcaceae bacterium]MCI1918974.1 hypothetical protein [Enterococcaceae bacterium]